MGLSGCKRVATLDKNTHSVRLLGLALCFYNPNQPQKVRSKTCPWRILWVDGLIINEWHHSILGTLVERTTRITLLIPLKNKDAISIRKAFAGHVKYLLKQIKLSMTYDRGGRWHNMYYLQEKPKWKCIFLIHKVHGNETLMKIPMNWFDNIFKGYRLYKN